MEASLSLSDFLNRIIGYRLPRKNAKSSLNYLHNISDFLMFGFLETYHINHCKRDKRKLHPHVSWIDAFRRCKFNSAHLPIIRSRDEMDHFLAFIKFAPQFYDPRNPLNKMVTFTPRFYQNSIGGPSPLSNEVIFLGMVTNSIGQVCQPHNSLNCHIFLDLQTRKNQNQKIMSLMLPSNKCRELSGFGSFVNQTWLFSTGSVCLLTTCLFVPRGNVCLSVHLYCCLLSLSLSMTLFSHRYCVVLIS